MGTVFRSLDALESNGYVARFQSSSRYILGPSVSRLRQALLSKFALRGVSLPYMRQLAFATGECVSLTMPVGWYGLRVAAAPGSNAVTSSPPLGDLRALHETLPGRAILSALSPEKIEDYRAWCGTVETVEVPPVTLATDLKEIARRGFALEIAAFAQSRAALSFPIRGSQGPLGALSIEGPVLRLDAQPEDQELGNWQAVVIALQVIVDSRSGTFIHPFGHMSPGDIRLTPG